MIEYNKLSREDNNKFFEKIALMNVTVFEELHYFLGKGIPYACTADCIISPKDKDHSEYFPALKKAAIEIYSEWDYRILSHSITKEDLKALDMIGDRIHYAKDSIELTWAGMQLHKAISPYINNGKFIPPSQVA